MNRQTIWIVFLTLVFTVGASAQTDRGCICPGVTVEGELVFEDGIRAAAFTAVMSDEARKRSTFSWTVNAGVIVSGQGTPRIVVDVADLPGDALHAALEIGGGWCPTCPQTHTGSVAVPTARLVDSTSSSNCESILARLDAFAVELAADPSATAFIDIEGSRTNALSAARLIERTLAGRMSNERSRVEVRKSFAAATKIAFWLVPAGAPPPRFDENEFPAAAVPPVTDKTPYLYSSETFDGVAGCKEPFDLEGFSAELKASPKARGRVVIRETSSARYVRRRREISSKLAGAGVAAGRVRFVYVAVRPNRLLESTELWLIP